MNRILVITLIALSHIMTYAQSNIMCIDTYETEMSPIQPASSNGCINGHEWVDLGLSVKWATCNVGASSPSDYGNYYAWGETRTKSSYTINNSATYGIRMGSIAGNSLYDVARDNWGGTWRMPTAREIDELINKCRWVWATQGGYAGYMITGPNGNSIFLPAAGAYNINNTPPQVGVFGMYWCATPVESYPYFEYDYNYAYELRFTRSFKERTGMDNRSCGLPVRPVSE